MLSAWSSFLDAEFQGRLLVMLGLAAMPCLVALWAATSRANWFWRALAVWGVLAALAPVRAYEPALAGALALPLIVGVLQFARWLRRDRQHPWTVRFGLRDLLLAMLLTGLSLALLRHLYLHAPSLPASALILPGLVAAALTVVAYWIVVGPRRWVGTAALVVLVLLSAGMLWPRVEWLYGPGFINAVFSYGLFPSRSDYVQGFAGTSYSLVIFVTLLMTAVGMTLFQSERQWLQQSARGLSALSAVAVGGATVGIYVQLAMLPPYPPSCVAPGDRGPQLVSLAARVLELNPAPASLADLRKSGQASAADELERHYSEALKNLQATNSLPFNPATDSTMSYFRETMSDRASNLRHLFRCFEAECLTAESSGDRDRALDLALASYRVGALSMRNGIYFELLVGYAVSGIGARPLVKNRHGFSREEAEKIVLAILRAEAEHEPFERIMQREHAFCERAFGWQARMSRILDFGREYASTADSVRQAMRRWSAINRLILVDLALRHYRDEHQTWPATLEDLMPHYLPSVPLDPFSSQPLRYRVAGDKFVLYSVGHDRVDNGGEFTGLRAASEDGYDIDLDTLTRP